MNQAKSTLMIAAAIAFTGFASPQIQPAEATMVQNEHADQLKKDRAFAEKVRALKDKHHKEWKILVDTHAREKADMADMADKPDIEKKALERQQDEAKLALKERQREEMAALKAQYKG